MNAIKYKTMMDQNAEFTKELSVKQFAALKLFAQPEKGYTNGSQYGKWRIFKILLTFIYF